MVDLKRIVSVIQIESVRLCEGHCRSGVHPSELAEAVTVKTSRKTTVVKEPTEDRHLRMEIAFTMEIRQTGEEEQLQAEIEGTFELSYSLPESESFTAEELEAFGEGNAIFNAWPYWREFVQASLARMTMPPVTLPVFRVMPADAAEESEQNEN